MNTLSSTRLHPLFRPDSFYRLATDDWLWFDGGQTAIRRFFEGLRKRELLAAGKPGADWGFDEQRNRELDEHLGFADSRSSLTWTSNLRERRAEKMMSQRVPVMGATPGEITRSVHLFDVGSSSVTDLGIRSINSVFPQTESSATFFPDVPGVPVDRSCLLLLISRSQLKLLETMNKIEPSRFPRLDARVPTEWSNLLDRIDDSPVNDPGQVLAEAIRTTMIDPEEQTAENLPQLRRAWWVSSVLSEAVGVSGVSEKVGIGSNYRFHREITLDRESPAIDADEYTAVLCVGPKADLGASHS